ncbi:MAG: cation:proton antiporter [Candidatus Woesearchaeota archaeon]
MINVLFVLLGIGIILFLGFFAEFLFKKIHVPDIIFLLIIGFLIGPHVLNYVSPLDVAEMAPIFTTFALIFLLFDGAFNISLSSFAKGALKSVQITLLNFLLSALVISTILFLFNFDLLVSIMGGFILGGISSAFVIPLIKQMKVKGRVYSILTLESALTDVFCIVMSFAILEIIINLSTLNIFTILIRIFEMFSIAGLIGIFSGLIWIIVILYVFKENKSYMITIAYLLLIYSFTEMLNGHGAIAALFFGLVLRNSKEIITKLTSLLNKINPKLKPELLYRKYNLYSINATTKSEKFFYSQLSFFLKTFFFVYIGILLEFSDLRIILISLIISIAVLFTRKISNLATKAYNDDERKLITSIFARGLAAAAIAQVVLNYNIPKIEDIVQITFTVIVFTIFLSSIKVFLLKRKHSIKQSLTEIK